MFVQRHVLAVGPEVSAEVLDPGSARVALNVQPCEVAGVTLRGLVERGTSPGPLKLSQRWLGPVDELITSLFSSSRCCGVQRDSVLDTHYNWEKIRERAPEGISESRCESSHRWLTRWMPEQMIHVSTERYL